MARKGRNDQHYAQHHHTAAWLCEELSRCKEGEIPIKLNQYIRAAKEAMVLRDVAAKRKDVAVAIAEDTMAMMAAFRELVAANP